MGCWFDEKVGVSIMNSHNSMEETLLGDISCSGADGCEEVMQKIHYLLVYWSSLYGELLPSVFHICGCYLVF